MRSGSMWNQAALLIAAAGVAFSCGKTTDDDSHGSAGSGGASGGDTVAPWGGSPVTSGGFGGSVGTAGVGAFGGNSQGGVSGHSSSGGDGYGGVGGNGSGGFSFGGAGGSFAAGGFAGNWADDAGAPSYEEVGDAWVVSRMYLGDVDRAGNAGPDAWQNFGRNLDDAATTTAASNPCTPLAGPNPDVVVDGPGGLDNSFGKNIVPILQAIDPELFSDIPTDLVADGHSLLIVGHGGIGYAYGSLANGESVTTQTGSSWLTYLPISPSVGTVTASRDVQLGFWGVDIQLPRHLKIHVVQGVLQGTLKATSLPDVELTNGDFFLAGKVPVSDLIGALHASIGELDDALCSGTALASIDQRIREAADVSYAPPGATPPSTCNAISIGIGLELKLAEVLGHTTTNDAPTPCL